MKQNRWYKRPKAGMYRWYNRRKAVINHYCRTRAVLLVITKFEDHDPVVLRHSRDTSCELSPQPAVASLCHRPHTNC